MSYQNVMVTDETTNGDFAVLARVDSDSGWVQVEATKGDLAAHVYALHLDSDDRARIEQIEDAEEGCVAWGDSAIVNVPNAVVYDLAAQVG